MVTLDWSLSRTGGVTLAELYVTSDTDTRVRIESHMEPVWPPRRQGVPVAGWNGTTYEGRVLANERLVVGYATPADPSTPPAEIVATPTAESDADLSVRDVVRSLGEAAPPRDVVADESRHQSDDPEQCRPATTDSETISDPSTRPERPAETHTTTADSDERPLRWLDAVDQRITTAEELTGVETVSDAKAAVASHGGIEEIRRLQCRLDRDSDHLETVRRRAAEYENRLDSLDVPLSTLERIA